ncbi:MAG: MBL fold metallo-hydrolase [Methylotenera sp.]|nr:MBL fold metallo-hydrolase [Methylotenera sp.]
MIFASIGSGSAGNCTVIEQQSTRLLLDCGFGIKEVVTRLQRLDLMPEQISGILVTHEHDDHAKGAFKFAAKYNIPVWLSYGTLKMSERYLPENVAIQLNIIDSHTSFEIQNLHITPYPVPHDAREPTQFSFYDGQRKLGVLTDAGASTAHIEQILTQSDALLLECNHDLTMLENGPYAWTLKKRVSSRLGHLDNASAAQLLSKLDNSKLKHIVAAHLSAKNNTQALVKASLSAVLNCAPDWIGIAQQHEGLDWRSLS